jgi:hypothetical protein
MLQMRDARIGMHRCLQAKYHELRQQFTTLRTLYYLIECAWCQRRIGWKRKTAAVPGDTSHGICPPCATDLFRKLQAMKDSQAGASSLTPQSVA